MRTRRRKNLDVTLPYVFIAVPIIIVIAVVYIVQLNKTVSDNIEQNISELAEHDLNSIMSNVQSTWNELDNLKKRFEVYQCATIVQMEEQMNLECTSGAFTHICMVGEDGAVYTDRFRTYAADGAEPGSEIDLLQFFDSGDEYVVSMVDDWFSQEGQGTEDVQNVLYGIRMDGFSVEGIRMVGLVGISDVASIRDRMIINSFVKDGKSRGYSVVIDENGDYVVNVDQGSSVRNRENFFEKIDRSRQTDLSREEIAAKMADGETFSFYFTKEDGDERVVYCMPFEETGIHWYFLMSVEQNVFSEQNHLFLTMSMAMLVAIVVVIVVVLIFMMIAQRKVITANAEASARSNFLANMSHEIRTPLNGIIGLLFLMKKDLQNGAETKIVIRRLSKAMGTADYLLSLINNVLDISKLQAGKVDMNCDVISPEQIVDDVWSMQKSNVESRGICFSVEKHIIAPWIIGDEVMVKQVLMNILSNAAKFTPAGGEVAFSVTQKEEDEGHVCTTFVCRDTGCGMSEAFLEHIWDSFSQERSRNEESIKGTGLGMAISKLLMDAMKGEISVESRPGEGSTFFVTLHSGIAEKPKQRKGECCRRADATLEESRNIRVLVAEDNDLNAEILLEILQGEGFETIHAPNGLAAVEAFRSSAVGTIDVILMDMQMPVMDGCTATMEIRRMDREDAREVSIFACTANNFNEDRERAEASGMDDFLSKPIDVNVLLKKLGSRKSLLSGKETQYIV